MADERAAGVAQWIADSVAAATTNGRFLVLAYCFPPNDRSGLTLLVTSRRAFGEVTALFNEEYPDQRLSFGRPLDPTQADYLATAHRAIRIFKYNHQDFNSLDSFYKRLVREEVSRIAPAHWYARGFLLLDICGYSRRSIGDQVSLRMLLDAAIRKSHINLLKNWSGAPDDARFNLIPTGDGFYIWSRRPSRYCDAITLALGALTLAELHRPRWEGAELQVRAAMAIDEVYTIPYSPLDMQQQDSALFQDALGPAPNNAARLCAAAQPGQLLIGDFSELHVGEDTVIRTVEALTKAAVALFNGAEDFQLRLDPERRLKTHDKHGLTHYCFNVCGQAFYYLATVRHTATIGLAADRTPGLGRYSWIAPPTTTATDT